LLIRASSDQKGSRHEPSAQPQRVPRPRRHRRSCRRGGVAPAGGLWQQQQEHVGRQQQRDGEARRTLRFAVAGGASADTPDPALAGTSFTLYMAANLYDTLVRADQNFTLTPALATSWSSTPDAKTWSFRLRDGVTFHGGGKLTSKDVAYSITRILNPKLASPALANISPFLKASGVSAPDPTTVKFQLSAPNAFFPQILAGLNFGIIPDGTTSFAKPAGSGPFFLQEFQPLANAKFARNTDYWRSGRPYLEAVNLVSIAEDSTRVQSLIGGSEDLVDNITGADVKLLAAQPGVQTLQIKAGGWVDLAAWGDTKPFNDPNVVTALKYAANRGQPENRNMAAFLRLAADGRLDLDQIPVIRVPTADAARAYAALAVGGLPLTGLISYPGKDA
jgi:ABC-type transport system substrate-binding protein